ADTSDGKCDADCSLREAIGAAPWGATITFGPTVFGTITLQQELVIDKSLTIKGPGARLLVIRGGQQVRILRVSGDISVNISSLSLDQGHNNTPSGKALGSGYGGGALFNPSGNVSLTGVVVSGSGGYSLGGGILNGVGGRLTVRQSIFQRNETTEGGLGGAIANFGSLTVVSSEFLENRGDPGAAIGNMGSATIANSTFAKNQSPVNGGAVANINGTMVILNS